MPITVACWHGHSAFMEIRVRTGQADVAVTGSIPYDPARNVGEFSLAGRAITARHAQMQGPNAAKMRMTRQTIAVTVTQFERVAVPGVIYAPHAGHCCASS